MDEAPQLRRKVRILHYLTRDILIHTVAVSLVLFLVVFAGRFIRYLSEAAIGSLTGDVLLPIMWYKLPGFLEMILPLSFFIGILLSLGKRYAESEMVVLSACGLSPSKLALYCFFPAALIMVLVAILSLKLAPAGSFQAQILLDSPRSAEGLHILNEGRFRKQRSGNYVTYVERIDDDGLMHNIFVFERKRGTDELFDVTLAEEGTIIVPENTRGRFLELRNGTQYQVEPGASLLTEMHFERYGEVIAESQGSLRAVSKVEALPTRELWFANKPEQLGAFWWRISLPLMVPSITVIALAMSVTDARRGRYAKVGPAMVVLLIYFLGLTHGRSQIEAGAGPGVLLSVHIGFALLAYVLLERGSLISLWRAFFAKAR